MSKLKSKQLFGVLTTTGDQSLTGSLIVTDTVHASYFSGSAVLLKDFPEPNQNSFPWLRDGSNLVTSQSFDVRSTGSFQIIGDDITGASDLFLVKNKYNQKLLGVSSSGVITTFVNDVDPALDIVAPYGAIYFTSASLFIGIN